MADVRRILKETELNALVIDIRDSGNMYVANDIPLAQQSKATQRAIGDLPALVSSLREEGIYTIARVACFRDQFVPLVRKDLAVQFSDGRIWQDRSGHKWLDPYNKENWEYVAAAVDIALQAGFDEIQLDYVRFPSEGKVSTMVFPSKASYEGGTRTPAEVVAAFCETIREKVHAQGRMLSADLFGIISSGQDDQGIGQQLEIVAKPFDLICPMVYPSHYAKGEYGIADPHREPYAIVLRSLQDFKRRLPEMKVRPWLQDFSLFGVEYGVDDVRAQIKATYAAGYDEFLIWNARNRYTEAAYKDLAALQPQPTASASP